jgi:drug/metabolite transporter (DMT)-like permease
VLAGAWLKQLMGWRRWLGVGIGVLGVTIMLRPGRGAAHRVGWAIMVMLGVLGAGGHFLLVLAHAHPPASVLALPGYFSLVWSPLFGMRG